MSGLPAGWRTIALDDAKAPGSRSMTDGPFGSNLKTAHYTSDGPHVVRLQNIGEGVYREAPAHISTEHFERLRAHEVLPGDLLVASLGEVLPRACLMPAHIGPAIVKADCIRVRLSDEVDPRWVMYALMRPEARTWAKEHTHGVGRPRLGLKLIRQIPIPIAPLDEQRRIVEILEDHLSRLDDARRSLSTAELRLERLMDSIIASAPELDGASEIDVGSMLASPLINGRSVPTADSGFPVLRLTAMKDGAIDLGERKVGRWTEVEAARYLVERGDMFVSRGNGSLRLVGRAARVIEHPDPVAFPDTMIRMRPDETRVRPDFLTLIWNSRRVRAQIERTARTTAGIFKVNQNDLQRVTVPVPPLPQQSRMVERVDESIGSVARIEKQVGAAQRRAELLRRSLLAAAFSGRLAGSSTDTERIEDLAEVGV